MLACTLTLEIAELVYGLAVPLPFTRPNTCFSETIILVKFFSQVKTEVILEDEVDFGCNLADELTKPTVPFGREQGGGGANCSRSRNMIRATC